ncbi:MAG: hypothetical protein K8J31_18580, partial [Anaerolineae bacterium]|nr:hypothetical protein [Anaerolineae bacterium]
MTDSASLKPWKLCVLVIVLALLPRAAIALQPIPVQLDKMLPDDAYYYFLTAENILTGAGPSVDGLNMSNGWHPLWMLVNLGIFALPTSDPNTPIYLILLLGALLDSLVAGLLFLGVRRFLGNGPALIGGGFYAINHMVIFQSV